MCSGFRNGVIKLDNKREIFYSGQELTGLICFDLQQPLTFSVLYVKYHGEASVLWTEQETEVVNGMERRYSVNYVGQESYFNFIENLIGGTGTSQLPAGSHVIPFKYKIPSMSPSSWKGTKGMIHYSVTAVMVHFDPLSTNEELSKEFQVVSPFDLNLADSFVKQPINIDFEEVYSCNCFCSPDSVAVRIQLPVSGYCPGQVIPIDVEVQNESCVEITKMNFEIVARECYRSKQPVAEFVPPEKVLAINNRGAVMANTKGRITCGLVVPNMIAPHLQNCSIIDVRYFFRVTVKMSGCNDELQDDSEIYIGLVPLKEFTESEYVHPLALSLPECPIPILDNDQVVRSPGFADVTVNTDINRFNAVQTAPYPNYQAPYPCDNPPYPTHNKVDIPMPTQRPAFRDYEIGFKAPESFLDSNPPYPDINNSPKTNYPYPKDNLMPSVTLPPYPTINLMPQMQVPYPAGPFNPSAPPPSN